MSHDETWRAHADAQAAARRLLALLGETPAA